CARVVLAGGDGEGICNACDRHRKWNRLVCNAAVAKLAYGIISPAADCTILVHLAGVMPSGGDPHGWIVESRFGPPACTCRCVTDSAGGEHYRPTQNDSEELRFHGCLRIHQGTLTMFTCRVHSWVSTAVPMSRINASAFTWAGPATNGL